MQILDDIVRKEIVAKAHKAARSHLMDALDTNAISADDIQEAYSNYKSWFLESLSRQFTRFKRRQAQKNTTFKRLLDKLAENGVTEHSITTPPLCLSVKYKGTKVSFTYSYEGAIAEVDGFRAKICDWDEDIVELIDIIHEECQDSKLFSRVHPIVSTHLAFKVQQKIMISTALGIMKAKMKDIEYEIISQSTIGDEIVIRFSTPYGIYMIAGPLDEFEMKIEDKIVEIQYYKKHNITTRFK